MDDLDQLPAATVTAKPTYYRYLVLAISALLIYKALKK